MLKTKGTLTKFTSEMSLPGIEVPIEKLLLTQNIREIGEGKPL